MFYSGLGCPCRKFRFLGWEEAVTDRMHRSGFVQTCKRWCRPASQLARGLHLQYLLPCFGHCLRMSKSEGRESGGWQGEGERAWGNRHKCAPNQPLPSEQPCSWEKQLLLGIFQNQCRYLWHRGLCWVMWGHQHLTSRREEERKQAQDHARQRAVTACSSSPRKLHTHFTLRCFLTSLTWDASGGWI